MTAEPSPKFRGIVKADEIKARLDEIGYFNDQQDDGSLSLDCRLHGSAMSISAEGVGKCGGRSCFDQLIEYYELPITVEDAPAWTKPQGGYRHEKIEEAAEKLRITEAAREMVRAEKSEVAVLPDLVTLSDFLAVPDDEAVYVIENVWPEDANVLLAAKEKTGKSTLIGNMLRSLVDGEPFLDQHKVQSQPGRIVLLDFELSERMMRRWLRDQDVQAVDRVDLVSMRGHAQTFNVLDEKMRSRWASMLGPGDVLVVDPLRPIIDALGMSEDKDGSKVTQGMSALCQEAGIKSWMLSHHMGHGAVERARGDSALLGTADVLWRLLREDQEKPMPQPVYFTAFGRDVDLPEERLVFNPHNRRLSAIGGTRAEAKGDRDVDGLMKHLRTVTDPAPPWNTTVIDGLAQHALGIGEKAARKVVALAVKDGLLGTTKVKNNATMHWLNDSFEVSL